MRAPILEIPDSLEGAIGYLHARGWTDGLPVIPPTTERVEAVLSQFPVPGESVIAEVAPVNGVLTFEKLVINAVLAGCSAEHIPLLVAAMEAVCDPRFNISGVQQTTGPHSPLCVINGPVRTQVGVNCGHNCFGQGTVANAVVGRAIRLILQNVGGGSPGRVDMATLGHPGKYTFCIGENEERSPWTSLAVERGFRPAECTVTMIACDAPQVIVDNTSTTAAGVLRTIANSLKLSAGIQVYMSGREMELVLVLCPEHATELAGEGWSKADVKQYIYEASRIPLGSLTNRGMYGNRTWPRWFEALSDTDLVPIVSRPENIIILVAGGAGRVSASLTTWHTSRSVTRTVPSYGSTSALQPEAQSKEES